MGLPKAYGASYQRSDLSRSGDLSHNCGNTGFFTHCARLGIEPTSQCSQDTADPIVPQWELPEHSSDLAMKPLRPTLDSPPSPPAPWLSSPSTGHQIFSPHTLTSSSLQTQYPPMSPTCTHLLPSRSRIRAPSSKKTSPRRIQRVAPSDWHSQGQHRSNLARGFLFRANITARDGKSLQAGGCVVHLHIFSCSRPWTQPWPWPRT